MARFFENSLTELEARNPGIESNFKRIDATRFTAAIYRDGKNLARCQIRLGGIAAGITFSQTSNPSDNSFNESLSVETDDQALYLRPLGIQMHRGRSGEAKLGLEGAAEYYWDMFIEPLQR